MRLESAAAATNEKDDNGDKNCNIRHCNSTVTTTSIDFDCPSWSTGWVTVPLQRGHVLRVTGSSSKQHEFILSVVCHSRAHDPLARPTVIPSDWQRAVDDIVRDYYCNYHNSNNNNSLNDDDELPATTNKHFAHASYFQEDHAASYFRDDDNDKHDHNNHDYVDRQPRFRSTNSSPSPSCRHESRR